MSRARTKAEMWNSGGCRLWDLSFEEKADVYVINTCSVTNVGYKKSRQMLHRAARIRTRW